MKVTLKTLSGFYICAEGGGGTIIEANRPLPGQDPDTVPGEWEEFEFVDRGNGIFALKSSGGFYIGVEPETNQLTIDRTKIGEWEEWTVVRGPEPDTLSIQSVYTSLFMRAEAGGGREILVDRTREELSVWECWIASVPLIEDHPNLPNLPDHPHQGFRKLVGPLRRENQRLRDDLGLVNVLFCSLFGALYGIKYHAAEFNRLLDLIAIYYQGYRMFMQVGGWTPFWDGRETNVMPFIKWQYDPKDGFLRPATDEHGNPKYGRNVAPWPDYNDQFRAVLRATKARGLRLQLTVGDHQIICADYDKELQCHRQWARIAADEGGLEVVALVEGCNEFNYNHFGGESDASINQLGKVLAIWESAIPGVLTCVGPIPGNEEPEALAKMSRFGKITGVNVTRDPIDVCLKHTAGLTYWEGDYDGSGYLYWQLEPVGPGTNSFAPNNDPANLLAVYAEHQLYGHGSTWFQGEAVLFDPSDPLDSEWGFKEIPQILAALLPDGVSRWEHGHNSPEHGVEYWWKDKDFRAVVYKDWNPAPPYQIAEWFCHCGTEIKSGKGNPPKGMTGLLYGKFK